MKTLIFMVILAAATAFCQNTNYASVPPLFKTLNEVIKAEKIDTAKAKYANGTMFITTRIEGDSALVFYKYDMENRLQTKLYNFFLRNSTGKTALNKFRAVSRKVTAKFGQPEDAELMSSSPKNDKEKLLYLSQGEPLMTHYETDSFYIMVSLYSDSESGIFKILVSYSTPEEWNKMHTPR